MPGDLQTPVKRLSAFSDLLACARTETSAVAQYHYHLHVKTLHLEAAEQAKLANSYLLTFKIRINKLGNCVGLNDYMTIRSLINSFIHSFTPFIVCLTTGPFSRPKQFLHAVPSCASSFNFQYTFFFLRSFSSCLRLLSRLPVTSILPSILPPLTCFRRRFLLKV